MEVIRVADVAARDATDNPIFRGKVSVQSIIGDSNDQLRVIAVHFSPGAINVFHTHTFDQVLYITEGKGIVTPGMIVFIPAGENHWHGATKDSAFSHIAVMPPGETRF